MTNLPTPELKITDIEKGYAAQAFGEALALAIANGIVAPGTQQLDHLHTSDLYARRCRIPVGTVGATFVHKADHIAVCLSGTVRLVDQDGNKQDITAPAVLITKAGTQRALYALTDVDWLTVHHTDYQDDDTIEDVLGYRSMDEYLGGLECH